MAASHYAVVGPLIYDRVSHQNPHHVILRTGVEKDVGWSLEVLKRVVRDPVVKDVHRSAKPKKGAINRTPRCPSARILESTVPAGRPDPMSGRITVVLAATDLAAYFDRAASTNGELASARRRMVQVAVFNLNP